MSHDPTHAREPEPADAETEAHVQPLPEDVLDEVAGGFCSIAYCSSVEQK